MSKRRLAERLLLGYLADQVDAITGGEAALSDDQSSVHPVRVGVRRFRSTVRTFRPFLEQDQIAALDAELKWYGNLLGEVRDRQVQRRRFTERIAALPAESVLGPVAGRIEQSLMVEQLAATADLTSALDSERYRALLEALRHFATDPPLVSRAGPADLRTLVAKSRRKTGKRLRRGMAGDDASLHRARKSAKRTRYAAELAEPVLVAAKDRRAAKRHEELQTVLGDHQDNVVAMELLRRWGAATAKDSAANGFTYGLLYERERAEAAESRRRAAKWRA